VKTALIALLALLAAGCKEGSNFGFTAGFAGAEVGYKYSAPRKSRVKKPTPTPTPTPTPVPTPRPAAHSTSP
jgi:hypothetical protein